MHLADAFIQSDLHCIQVTVSTFLSALAFPGKRTHDLGVASAMLYQLSYRKATWADLLTRIWQGMYSQNKTITSQVCSGQDWNGLSYSWLIDTEVFVIYKKYLIGRNVQWLCLHIVCFTFTLCMCYFHLYMFDVFREKKNSPIIVQQVCTSNYFLWCACCSI